MRQNRIKKFLTAGLSGLLILSLTGCGQAAKLPETVENTSLVVEKDGKVTSYLVNTFDKDFYNLDGLTQMVEEEAEEFNATHTEATENPMNVKTVQALPRIADTTVALRRAGFTKAEIDEINSETRKVGALDLLKALNGTPEPDPTETVEPPKGEIAEGETTNE